MSEVKWIKITTNMFDNRKIRHLRKLPEGNNIVLIWVMLLTMAGRCNHGGMIFLTENIPYTTKMLADELEFEESTIVLAIEALERFGMICTDENSLSISGWEEHQNAEALEKIREDTRKRVAKHREKRKLLECNVTCNVTDGYSNALEEEREEEREEDKETEEKRDRVNYQAIVDMYNDTCVSFPRLSKLSESRKKAIRARLNTYTVEDFKTVFQKAEASPFLKGKNSRNWSATFDWMMKDANFAKILDGNYDDKSAAQNEEEKEDYDTFWTNLTP